MDYFFHADTAKYRRRFKGAVIITAVPVFGICVFCTVNILLNIGSGASRELIGLMAGIIFGCVAAGVLAIFASAYICYKLDRRHSRFTYIDILPDCFVYSVYAGEYREYSAKVVLRRLYVVPFSEVTDIIRDGKKTPLSLTVLGAVRCYLSDSDDLGYHVDEDNHMRFDHAELDVRGFETADKLLIEGRFGRTKRLEKALKYYLEQYRSIPEKKPFDITEHIAKHQKKRPVTSNPLLEAPSYDRDWR